MADELRFTHVFNRNLRCTLRIKDEPPTAGAMFQINTEWVGRPKKKHVGEYRRWILCTYQFLIDRWNTTGLYALGVAPDLTEFWRFEPGKAPKLSLVTNVGIP